MSLGNKFIQTDEVTIREVNTLDGLYLIKGEDISQGSSCRFSHIITPVECSDSLLDELRFYIPAEIPVQGYKGRRVEADELVLIRRADEVDILVGPLHVDKFSLLVNTVPEEAVSLTGASH